MQSRNLRYKFRVHFEDGSFENFVHRCTAVYVASVFRNTILEAL